MLLEIFPNWNSLDSVRRAHSDLELAGLVFFALLVVAEALAHNSKQEERKHLFDSIGIWFFAIAVLCEIAGYRYGQRNDALSEQVISSLDVKARNADTKAQSALDKSSTADTEAGEALTKSTAANEAAGKAQSKVIAVSKEADATDTKLKLALPMLSRRSVQHPKGMEGVLKLYSWPEPIVIRSYNGDAEAWGVCLELGFAMVPPMTPRFECGNEPLTLALAITGIEITGKDVLTLRRLREILVDDGGLGDLADIRACWPCRTDGPSDPTTIELFIGLNPGFSLARLEAAENKLNKNTKQTKPKK
ncbi:MAG: hypothetical protein ABSA78_15125 [Candidatus Sulfotelmatobacter sp.]